jgi:hypothetical protein
MSANNDLPDEINYQPNESVKVIYKNTVIPGKIIGMPYQNRLDHLTYLVEFEPVDDLIPTKMQVPRVYYLIKKN